MQMMHNNGATGARPSRSVVRSEDTALSASAESKLLIQAQKVFQTVSSVRLALRSCIAGHQLNITQFIGLVYYAAIAQAMIPSLNRLDYFFCP